MQGSTSHEDEVSLDVLMTDLLLSDSLSCPDAVTLYHWVICYVFLCDCSRSYILKKICLYSQEA